MRTKSKYTIVILDACNVWMFSVYIDISFVSTCTQCIHGVCLFIVYIPIVQFTNVKV